jgi:hypothetical protein
MIRWLKKGERRGDINVGSNMRHGGSLGESVGAKRRNGPGAGKGISYGFAKWSRLAAVGLLVAPIAGMVLSSRAKTHLSQGPSEDLDMPPVLMAHNMSMPVMGGEDMYAGMGNHANRVLMGRGQPYSRSM